MRAAILTALIIALASPARAGVVDGVAAFVDTEAITLSELKESHETMLRLNPEVTEREVLDTMINRLLLVREARRLRLEASDEDGLLDDYIDLKIRAFIKINEDDVREFYAANPAEFGGRPYAEVRDDIEAFLTEKEVNYRLRRHIESLTEKANIRILLERP